METVETMHTKAMDYYQLVRQKEYLGETEKAQDLRLKALALEEKAAAHFLPTPTPESEPTRGILYRSAAWMACNLEFYEKAVKLADEGLRGCPFPEIEAELKEVKEKALREWDGFTTLINLGQAQMDVWTDYKFIDEEQIMITNYQPIAVLPELIQRNWLAQVKPAVPTKEGVFRLVGIRPTKPHTYEEQRLIVLVIDEDGHAMPSIDIAFSYSTAEQYTLTNDFLWTPPSPQKAFIVPTRCSGEIDQIQGEAVNKDESGGVTVYVLEGEYSSDVVTGLGMLVDHTGLHLTFQLRRVGVTSTSERLDDIDIESAVCTLADAINTLADVYKAIAVSQSDPKKGYLTK